jgi:hypothetical protein
MTCSPLQVFANLWSVTGQPKASQATEDQVYGKNLPGGRRSARVLKDLLGRSKMCSGDQRPARVVKEFLAALGKPSRMGFAASELTQCACGSCRKAKEVQNVVIMRCPMLRYDRPMIRVQTCFDQVLLAEEILHYISRQFNQLNSCASICFLFATFSFHISEFDPITNCLGGE